MTRKRIGLVVALTAPAFLHANQTTTVEQLDHPLVPMYAICAGSIPGTLSAGEITLLHNTYDFLQGGFDATQRATLQSAGTKVIRYMNSTYTESTAGVNGGVHTAEAIKPAIACTWVAWLKAFVSNSATATTVKLYKKDFDQVTAVSSLPVFKSRTSYTDPDYSGHGNSISDTTSNYVFWIRIGRELMRVDDITNETSTVLELQVTRGYAGTPIDYHHEWDAVCSPLYVGASSVGGGTTGNYPEGAADELRYCLDPFNDDGNQNRTDIVYGKVTNGFDGAWLDTLNQGTFNLCNAFGDSARPWDWSYVGSGTATNPEGREYPEETFRDGQLGKIEYMKDYVDTATGGFPYLVANNLKDEDLLDADNDGDLLMAELLDVDNYSDPDFLLDGFCMEDFFEKSKNSIGKFTDYLEALRIGINHGFAMMPVSGNAGSGSWGDEDLDDTARRDLQLYSYCFYLLAIKPGAAAQPAKFGTYGLYSDPSDKNVRHVEVEPEFMYPLGEPGDDWTDPAAYTGYQVGSTDVYRRDFENGIVFVNAGASDTSVALGGTYIDTHATPAEYVSGSVTIPAKSGRIYLSQPTELPDAPWQTTEIGAPDYRGYAKGSSGSYTVAGGGDGVGGTNDECTYMFQTANDNCEIVARIDSGTGGSGAVAGVMMRQSLADNAKTIYVARHSDGTVSGQYRGGSGNTFANGDTNPDTPAWVKISRVGNSSTYLYTSTDGSTWVQLGGEITVNFGSGDIELGIAVTNTDDTALASAGVSNVSVTP